MQGLRRFDDPGIKAPADPPVRRSGLSIGSTTSSPMSPDASSLLLNNNTSSSTTSSTMTSTTMTSTSGRSAMHSQDERSSPSSTGMSEDSTVPTAAVYETDPVDHTHHPHHHHHHHHDEHEDHEDEDRHHHRSSPSVTGTESSVSRGESNGQSVSFLSANVCYVCV